MAVEQDLAAAQHGQERHAERELVHNKVVVVLDVARCDEACYEVQLAKNGAENVKFSEDGNRLKVAVHVHIQFAGRHLIETVGLVAVGGVDGNGVAIFLEAHGCVDHKTLCAAYAQVWMDEGDFHCGVSGAGEGQ